MVGLFKLSTLLSLASLLASCSHIEADPSFWPGTKHRLRTVPPTNYAQVPLPQAVVFKESPSLRASTWKLIKKSSFAQRTYELVLRDKNDRLMDSPLAPEILLEGEVSLKSVVRVKPATWHVTLEFLKDQNQIKLGLQVGGHRLEHFRQFQFHTQELDFDQSKIFSNKARLRADGRDTFRLQLDLKDTNGTTIYSPDDFTIRVITDSKDVHWTGPHSGITGPYFKFHKKSPGKMNYKILVDDKELNGMGAVEFVDNTLRSPAAEKQSCLQELTQAAGERVAANGLVEQFEELVGIILKRYEEKQDATPETFSRTLTLFSSPACSRESIFDEVREEAGRKLRASFKKLNR